MSDATRRGFLKYTAAGAAATAAAAVTSSALAPDAGAAPALPRAAKGSMVVYIHDVHSGELAVMVDGHEVTVKDPALVARIAHVLHSAGPVPS